MSPNHESLYHLVVCLPLRAMKTATAATKSTRTTAAGQFTMSSWSDLTRTSGKHAPILVRDQGRETGGHTFQPKPNDAGPQYRRGVIMRVRSRYNGSLRTGGSRTDSACLPLTFGRRRMAIASRPPLPNSPPRGPLFQYVSGQPEMNRHASDLAAERIYQLPP